MIRIELPRWLHTIRVDNFNEVVVKLQKLQSVVVLSEAADEDCQFAINRQAISACYSIAAYVHLAISINTCDRIVGV